MFGREDLNLTGQENNDKNEAGSREITAEELLTTGSGAPEEQSLSEHERDKIAWEKEKEELMNRLMRKQADFDNFRRISRAEQEEAREYSLFKFLEKFLSVLDNLERALESARAQAVPDSYKEGLEMICRQVVQLLEQEGVVVIDCAGKVFDPHYHHAVMQVEEGAPGCVAEELQKGYLYKKKVLRPAMVKICRG